MGDFAKDFWLAYQLQPLCKINFLFESNNVCLVTTRSVRQRVDAVKRTAEGDPAKLMRQSPRAWVFLGNHRGFFKGQTVFNNIKNYWAPKLEVCIWSLFNYFGRTQSANIYIYIICIIVFFNYPGLTFQLVRFQPGWYGTQNLYQQLFRNQGSVVWIIAILAELKLMFSHASSWQERSLRTGLGPLLGWNGSERQVEAAWWIEGLLWMWVINETGLTMLDPNIIKPPL